MSDAVSKLSARVAKLEHQIDSFSRPLHKCETVLESQERELENLRLLVEHLQQSFGEASAVPRAQGTTASPATPKSVPCAEGAPATPANPKSTPRIRTAASSPTDVKAIPPARPPRSSPEKLQNRLDFPMNRATSLDGIISYLTKKHGGNVHEKGIVTLTSKSFCGDPVFALQHVADLTSEANFCSGNEPGQWFCWDFGALRVFPTHYTLWTCPMKSWVIEVSMDGQAWTTVDRKAGVAVFAERWGTASFAVSNPDAGRYIRLLQTEKTKLGYDMLSLIAVEFFGTVYE
jgi:hypothetical protein